MIDSAATDCSPRMQYRLLRTLLSYIRALYRNDEGVKPIIGLATERL